MQVLGITGLSQATSNVITTTGNSQEFYEFATADATVLYIDCSATSGAPNVALKLLERDPATGVFNDSGTTFAAVTGVTSVPQRVVVDPCYAEAYQLSWTFTGSGSATMSVVALLVLRD
jgi:hypothetical protein